MPRGSEFVALGGGCFWCIEAFFSELKGVHSAVSGYAGGSLPNPTYEQVSMGTTGHAEVVKVEFDPTILPFETLLDVFFAAHDPTTLNAQGHDIGEQYRSIILYTSEAQRKAALKKIEEFTHAHTFSDPIVTEIKPLEKFYEAEPYHQRYFANNPEESYCSIVIAPKVKKLRKEFGHLLPPL